VYVNPQRGSGIGHGITCREPVGIINVSVGTGVTDSELRRDWVLVHEMIHLALPNLERRHVWLAEGTATYVESVAASRLETWPRPTSGPPCGRSWVSGLAVASRRPTTRLLARTCDD